MNPEGPDGGDKRNAERRRPETLSREVVEGRLASFAEDVRTRRERLNALWREAMSVADRESVKIILRELNLITFDIRLIRDRLAGGRSVTSDDVANIADRFNWLTAEEKKLANNT